MAEALEQPALPFEENEPTVAIATVLSEEEAKAEKEAEKREALRVKFTKQVKDALNTPREIVTRTKTGERKTTTLPPLGECNKISARELWLYCVGKTRPIDWIDSYKALLKYVSKDFRTTFDPYIKGGNSGTRYYVKVDNVVEFLVKFDMSDFKIPTEEKAVA